MIVTTYNPRYLLKEEILKSPIMPFFYDTVKRIIKEYLPRSLFRQVIFIESIKTYLLLTDLNIKCES